MQGLGFRVKSLRQQEGLTQKEFSKKLFISQSYLSGIEKGNIIITEKLFRLICLEFGVNPQWLNTGEGEMYDDVFEDDPEYLYKISNEMILQLMQLLSTKSNVEYGHITYSFQALINILNLSNAVSKERMEYLESIERLLADIERMLSVFEDQGSSYRTFDIHKENIISDLKSLFELF
ncbi:MAG: helix-turn-helix domain-containing protein [Bacteroides sp.]|nr:helix-turn-helix domain-containing protein [Roseburia sp.]MCM1462981.1 helix-turn-helix domain-containing protein [Bacteroides sp.]